MATYYVKNGGNNANTGLSDAQAWETIAKVNSVSFDAGDSVLFKRGSTWTEELVIPTSGTTGAGVITFGAYDTGADPIITGFTTISGWTDEGGGIYSKVITYSTTPNMVTIDGVNQKKGTWPSTGYYNIDSHSGSSTITASELSGQDWDGATVATKLNMSLLKTGTITDHTGSTITISGIGEEFVTDWRVFYSRSYWYIICSWGLVF